MQYSGVHSCKSTRVCVFDSTFLSWIRHDYGGTKQRICLVAWNFYLLELKTDKLKDLSSQIFCYFLSGDKISVNIHPFIESTTGPDREASRSWHQTQNWSHVPSVMPSHRVTSGILWCIPRSPGMSKRAPVLPFPDEEARPGPLYLYLHGERQGHHPNTLSRLS